jgi:two-component system, NarL family, nitrate/nitrite response regulator NarL
MNPRISVVVASDFPHVSRHVSASLKSTPESCLIGIATDGTGALHLARLHRPNVVIISLSVRQPVLKGLVSALSADGVCPVIMSDVIEDAEVLELLQFGLAGVLPCSVTHELLCHSVHAIAAGEIWIRREMIGKLIDQMRGSTEVPAATLPKVTEKTVFRPKPQPENHFNLTQRELQIVQATTEGLTNKEIASSLNISEFTVKHHLAKIFDKLGVYSRLELATFAVHHNLCKQATATQLVTPFKFASTVRERTGTF